MGFHSQFLILNSYSSHKSRREKTDGKDRKKQKRCSHGHKRKRSSSSESEVPSELSYLVPKLQTSSAKFYDLPFRPKLIYGKADLLYSAL